MAEIEAAVGGNLQKIEKLYIPQKTKNTEFLEGPPAEVAKKLAVALGGSGGGTAAFAQGGGPESDPVKIEDVIDGVYGIIESMRTA
jgi:alanyl-tRNA synthetase